MIRSRVVALSVLGSLILAVAGQSAAQVRYVDETGGVHWAQSAEQVPEKYHSKASEPQLPDVRLKGAQITGREYTGSASPRTSGSASPSSYSSPALRAAEANDATFRAGIEERQRQLDEQKQAAAERRAKLEAESKERRAEQRADESLQLQRESVNLQRGRR